MTTYIIKKISKMALVLTILFGMAIPASALTLADLDLLIALGIIPPADRLEVAQALGIKVPEATSKSFCDLEKIEFNIGDTGSLVVDLQVQLQNAGYLVMPAGVSMGYYGMLTSHAFESWKTASLQNGSAYYDPFAQFTLICDDTNPGDTYSQLTVLSPNGGEIWEKFSQHRIAWAPDSHSNDVVAYVDKKTSKGFIEMGEAIKTGKGSIIWDTEIGRSGNYSTPEGKYYIRLVNTVTGETDRSDEPFRLVDHNDYVGIDLEIKHKGRYVDDPFGSTSRELYIKWKTDNADTCLLNIQGTEGQYVKDIGTSGSKTIYLPDNGIYISDFGNSSHNIIVECRSSDFGGNRGSDSILVQIVDESEIDDDAATNGEVLATLVSTGIDTVGEDKLDATIVFDVTNNDDDPVYVPVKLGTSQSTHTGVVFSIDDWRSPSVSSSMTVDGMAIFTQERIAMVGKEKTYVIQPGETRRFTAEISTAAVPRNDDYSVELEKLLYYGNNKFTRKESLRLKFETESVDLVSEHGVQPVEVIADNPVEAPTTKLVSTNIEKWGTRGARSKIVFTVTNNDDLNMYVSEKLSNSNGGIDAGIVFTVENGEDILVSSSMGVKTDNPFSLEGRAKFGSEYVYVIEPGETREFTAENHLSGASGASDVIGTYRIHLDDLLYYVGDLTEKLEKSLGYKTDYIDIDSTK